MDELVSKVKINGMNYSVESWGEVSSLFLEPCSDTAMVVTGNAEAALVKKGRAIAKELEAL